MEGGRQEGEQWGEGGKWEGEGGVSSDGGREVYQPDLLDIDFNTIAAIRIYHCFQLVGASCDLLTVRFKCYNPYRHICCYLYDHPFPSHHHHHYCHHLSLTTTTTNVPQHWWWCQPLIMMPLLAMPFLMPLTAMSPSGMPTRKHIKLHTCGAPMPRRWHGH